MRVAPRNGALPLSASIALAVPCYTLPLPLPVGTGNGVVCKRGEADGGRVFNLFPTTPHLFSLLI